MSSGIWGIFGLIVVIFFVMTSRKYDKVREGQGKRFSLAAILIGALSIFLILSSFIKIIDAGYVGIPIIFGKVQDWQLSSGLHFVNPLIEIEHMSVRTQDYTMSIAPGEGVKQGDDSITVISSDGLSLPVDISIAYRISSAHSGWLYKSVGNQEACENVVIRPAARTAVRNAFAQFTAQEAYSTQRKSLQEAVASEFSRTLQQTFERNEGIKGEPVIVQNVLIRNVSLPDTVRQAVEQKISNQQESESMEFTLIIAKKEAQKKRIEAQGIADYQRIVGTGVTDKLLKWKGIEATEKLAGSPNAKIIVIGGKDGMPLILNQ
jgi:regulator of protease activity HflC (stomatin/prohibitin superfamily)